MSRTPSQLKVKQQSMFTRPQLPSLPLGKSQKNMRPRSQLLEFPAIQFNQKHPKKFHQKQRIVKKDHSAHTSCTSSELTNENLIGDEIVVSHKCSVNHYESAKQSRNVSPELVSILSDRIVAPMTAVIIRANNPQRDDDDTHIRESEDEDLNAKDDLRGKLLFDDFRDILPLKILNFTIKKVSWDDFTASSDANSQWKAHTFWCVGYSYDIKMRKMKKSNQIKYRLVIFSWAALTEKCWVRFRWSRLLEHETGHYLIGCLCALEFKKRADKQKFTQNYRIEAQKLFNATFNEYLQMELLYDKETDHSRDVQTQKGWNLNLISQLLDYQTFFSKSDTKN